MKKEIEPLEALGRIKSICENYMCGFTVIKTSKEGEKKLNTDLGIIQKALKEYELMKQTKPFAEVFGEPYTQEEYKTQCERFGFVITKAPQSFCYVEVE